MEIIIMMMKIEMIMFDESLYINKHLYSLVIIIIIFFCYLFMSLFIR